MILVEVFFFILTLELVRTEIIFKRFRVIQNAVIPNTVQTTNAETITRCSMACVANKTCLVFEYNEGLQKCKIGTHFMLSSTNTGQTAYIRDLSYKLVQIMQDYFQSKAYCEMDGGQLVKVLWDWLAAAIVEWCDAYGGFDPNANDILDLDGYGPFLGLNDIAVEGVYVWSDGTPLGPYTNWEHGVQHNTSWEDCVHIWHHSGAMGQWNNIGCESLLYSICQYD